jgi:hypothetical protein
MTSVTEPNPLDRIRRAAAELRNATQDLLCDGAVTGGPELTQLLFPVDRSRSLSVDLLIRGSQIQMVVAALNWITVERRMVA